MKKIIRSAAILLIPILLYYGVFLAFEPNNFFGLRAETPSGAVFGAIKGYQKNPVPSVIIGDSRLAHLNMDLVEETAGKPYGNLAFGGASLKELLDLTDWLLARYELEEIVFGTSFYTINAAYTTDRFETIETALNNPFAYLTSLSYNLETVQNVGHWLNGEVLGGGEAETEDPADYLWQDYTTPAGETVQLRTRIAQYLADISSYTSRWEVNEEQFTRLLETIDACAEKGIRFVVVLSPAHEAIVKYDMEPNGIAAQMAGLVAQLKETPALVLDYELTNRPNFAEDQFYDGFHLDYVRGLPEFTKLLFTDIAQGGNGHGA